MMILTLLGAILIAISAYHYHQTAKRIGQIRNTPTTAMSRLNQGQHEIVGTVSDKNKNVKAPLSGKDCVFFNLMIEEQISSGKHYKWDVRVKDRSSGHLIVEDGSGNCHLNLEAAKLEFDVDEKSISGTLDNPTEDEKRALAKYDQELTNLLGLNNTYRYTESILEAGDPIYAYGSVECPQGLPPVMRCEFAADKKEEDLLKALKKKSNWLTIGMAASAGLAVAGFLL